MSTKKTIRFLFILITLFVPLISNAEDLGLIRLSLIEGDVQVLIPGTTDWTPAGINLPLNEHDRVWVPRNSRAELQIKGGVYTRAGDGTSLDILTMNRDSAQFFLGVGHVYINNREGGIGNVQIDTPVASLRSYDSSVFLVDVSEDGESELSVMKGVVYAESRAGATQVSAGNTLTIRGENDARISPIGAADEWEQWNVERDRQVAAWSAGSRYLPDELREYAPDLDQNGRWDYLSGYGYAWSPAAVAPDWAPYSFGSWLWIRGNYVWVAYEPWGWAPYHYGRWVFVGSRWCWVPPAHGSVYWGPGYVGWVVTSSYVAWVPLAPGEIYYGYGYYGPGSVNIAAVNVDVIEENRSYRNAHSRNSVVAVRRDTFGTGRRVPVKVEENPFERGARRRTEVAPPRTRPERPVVVAPPPEVRGMHRSSGRDRTGATGIERRRGAAQLSPAPGARERARIQNRTPRRETPSLPSASQPSIQQPPEGVRRRGTESLKNESPLARQPGDLPVTRSEQPHVNRRSSGTIVQSQPDAQQPQERRALPRRSPEQRHPGR